MSDEPHGRLAESLAARREKVERLRGQGIEPFALSFDPDASLGEIRKQYDGLEPGRVTEDRYRVAGRIMLLRRQGKLTFATIRDGTGDLQLFIRQNDLDEAYGLVDELDLGDIVGAAGPVMTTKRGELSLRVDELVLLTKALRPLPEKWHGLRDPEARLRRRYLDLATNLESRRVVTARAAVLSALRRELEGRGFVEVETPVLQLTHGGALARPFLTHHRVLDTTLYLRIAPELYLKRLLVGGFERVYEIGRNFRNEGIDRDHNPEFTMLEAYQAYGDYEDMMGLDEALVSAAALAVRGSLQFEYREEVLDLTPPWRRVTLVEAVSEAIGEEVSLDRADLPSVAERARVAVDPKWGPGKILLEIYEKVVEERIVQPTFVKDFPREVSPLARPHRSSPGFTEHFDLVIGGFEIGPAYSELTDPLEQRDRFEGQQRERKAGDEEAHPLDEDFIVALEHGMPPAGGMGLGVDRLTMILADAPSIRDVILFPHLRPEPERG
ncbi:MAG TPA: lysine--tRNA ligase [Actinomycetota bacterium]